MNNKEKHSLRNFAALQSGGRGELLKEIIPLYLKRDFWYKRS